MRGEPPGAGNNHAGKPEIRIEIFSVRGDEVSVPDRSLNRVVLGLSHAEGAVRSNKPQLCQVTKRQRQVIKHCVIPVRYACQDAAEPAERADSPGF
jgi:hypothetical protein